MVVGDGGGVDVNGVNVAAGGGGGRGDGGGGGEGGQQRRHKARATRWDGQQISCGTR